MTLEVLRPAAAVAFPTLVIVAALTDITRFIIPNWISLALMALAVPAALAFGVSPTTMGFCLAVGVGALSAAIGMFALGWIGGGDAKLFAAAALWIGLPGLTTFLAVTALAGGALAVSLLGLRSAWLRPFAAHGPGWVGRLASPGGDVPYGVAICIGALAAFPQAAIGGSGHGFF